MFLQFICLSGLALLACSKVAAIGEPRPPVSKEEALGTVALAALLAVLVTFA